MLQTLRILVVILVVVSVGCAKYELPSVKDPKYVISQSVDADQNGVIDEKDVQLLEVRANDCFDILVRPFFNKVGIELETEQDIYTEENTDILKNNLTVAEWEKLSDGMDQWNKIRIQLEATKMRLDESPPVVDFGIVRGLAYYPDKLIAILHDSRFVYLNGISVPTHASRYRRMSDDMFYKLALNKVVKIEYDVVKYAGDFLYAYIYVGDVFVNEEMVARGYAKAKPTPPNHKYDSLFMNFEKEAKEQKRGIWSFTDEF